jgi:hypothetical protein
VGLPLNDPGDSPCAALSQASLHFVLGDPSVVRSLANLDHVMVGSNVGLNRVLVHQSVVRVCLEDSVAKRALNVVAHMTKIRYDDI